MVDFTIDQIKDVLETFLKDEAPKLNNIIDVTLFISKVAKKILNTVTNETLTATQKIKTTIDISEMLVDELELRTIISLELAAEFRETLKNSESITEMFASMSVFTDAITKVGENFLKDNSEKSWVKGLQNCFATFGCLKSSSVDETVLTKKEEKSMSALAAVLSVADDEETEEQNMNRVMEQIIVNVQEAMNDKDLDDMIDKAIENVEVKGKGLLVDLIQVKSLEDIVDADDTAISMENTLLEETLPPKIEIIEEKEEGLNYYV
jgi:hypothetical protein